MIKWRRFCRILKRLNVNSEYCVKRVNFFSAWDLFITRTFCSRIMTWDLQSSKNTQFWRQNSISYVLMVSMMFMFFLMIKWSSDKVQATVNKFGVHSRHLIRCFLLHYAVFCLANVNINTLPVYFYGIWKDSFSQESMFWCLYVYLIPYIHQRPKPDGYKWRLSFIHYHCVSCHSSSVFWRNIWLHHEYDWTFV